MKRRAEDAVTTHGKERRRKTERKRRRQTERGEKWGYGAVIQPTQMEIANNVLIVVLMGIPVNE